MHAFFSYVLHELNALLKMCIVCDAGEALEREAQASERVLQPSTNWRPSR